MNKDNEQRQIKAMIDGRMGHITGKPDYINKKLKKVSKKELLAAIKEVHEKNERERYEMMVSTAQALHGNQFVCLPRKK